VPTEVSRISFFPFERISLFLFFLPVQSFLTPLSFLDHRGNLGLSLGRLSPLSYGNYPSDDAIDVLLGSGLSLLGFLLEGIEQIDRFMY
jgi:hypothetical protein